MKYRNYSLFNVFMVINIFLFIACDDKNEPSEQSKNQIEIIENLFGENYSTTVKGYLTDSEWNGVVNKIELALNNAFPINGTTFEKNQFRGVFINGDVEIIVEKNHIGYTKWKTSTDGKAIYLAYAELNNNLIESINAIIIQINSGEAGFI